VSTSRIRKIAQALALHAARTLPPSHAAWGEAMVGEVERLGDDWAALDWAIGCAMAAYYQRTGTMTKTWTTSLRWIGAALLGVHAAGTLLVANLALVLNLQSPGTLFAPGGGPDASALGQAYPAFLPQLLSAPIAAITLWAGAGVLYLVATYRLLYGRAGVATVLAAALALDLLNVFVQRALPFTSQTVYVGDWRIGTMIALLLPAVGFYLLLLQDEQDGAEGAR
jgi:hypothetical protein